VGSRTVCPACDSGDVQPDFQKSEFDIWKCSHCGSLFVNNTPEPNVLNSIYRTETYYELSSESVTRIIQENRRRLKLLKRYGAKGNILDIGCARGLLLNDALAMGFNTYGTELSENNVRICLQNNHKVVKGYIDDIIDVPADNFDVITCLDVIEHVELPIEFMSKITRLLAPEGILVISTPNYSGLVAKLLKHKDPYIIPPEHLNFFTWAGMEKIFHQSGLVVRKSATFGRLTSEEKERSISKYFPKYLSPLGSIIKFILPGFFQGLNLLKIGIEQEFYLSLKG